MPRHPIELTRKHYEELPAVLKQALFSVEIAEQMFEIGKKFGLTIEKTGIMAEETGYLMLGLARPNELVSNLANELGLDANKAQDIAAEINHRIFFPLREELKHTHDFDMEIALPTPLTIGKTAGMPMPEQIKKTFVEEKSPLVSDLTRVRDNSTLPIPQKTSTVVIPAFAGIQEAEQKTGFPITSEMTETSQLKPAPASPPSFEPPASPTGRIADLQKMVEKPLLPVTVTPQPELKPSVVSTVEPWEKDLEKEVSSLLTKKPTPASAPIDLRPQQKPVVPHPPLQSKLPPIDLRPTQPTPIPPPQPTPPAPPRMTPQMQGLVIGNEIGPTLLEEKLRRELPEKAAAPKITLHPMPLTQSAPTVLSELATAQAVGAGDPYREPVDETNI